MRVGCAFYFETEGIWAERSVAGSSVTSTLDDVVIRVDFPATANAFEYPYATGSVARVPEGEEDASIEPPTARPERPPALEDQGGTALTLRVLRIVANADAPDELRQLPPGSAEARAQYDAAIGRMRAAARLAVKRLVDWVRIDRGQVWMSPPLEYPEQIGSEQLVDLDRNMTLGVTVFTGGTLLVLPADTELRSPDLVSLASRLPEEPPLWSRLLADAQHYTWSPEWAAPDRAVLFAAIALELAVKDALRTLAADSARPIVDLLLDSPRDWSVAAASLFDKPMDVVAKRSLRVENLELWKRVDRLFQWRNRIAHRGQRLENEESKQLVASAVEAMTWLQSLQELGPSGA